MADMSYQFVGPMLQAMHSIAGEIGTDIMGADTGTYRLAVELLALQAMTLKIIQDLHPDVVTDAVLQQRLNIAVDTGLGGDRSGWPGWILLQVRPDDLARYGATTTDTVPQLQAKIAAFNQGA